MKTKFEVHQKSVVIIIIIIIVTMSSSKNKNIYESEQRRT